MSDTTKCMCGSPGDPGGTCTQGHVMPTALYVRQPFQRDTFAARVVTDGECWQWTGGTIGGTSGQYREPGAGRRVMAHRYAYETMVGPIGPDESVVHVCPNTLCVRPDHLAVMDADKVGRGLTLR